MLKLVSMERVSLHFSTLRNSVSCSFSISTRSSDGWWALVLDRSYYWPLGAVRGEKVACFWFECYPPMGHWWTICYCSEGLFDPGPSV